MKTKKKEKKLELKKITIANLINQEMGMARGGTATSRDTKDSSDCPVPKNSPAC